MAPTTETKEREGRIHPGFAAMAGLDSAPARKSLLTFGVDSGCNV